MSTQLKDIYRLLELFYDGNTSPGQEEELYIYFSTGNVPEDLLHEKDIFLRFYNLNRNEKINIPAGLENKLSEVIEKLDSETGTLKNKKLKLWMQVGTIAASVAIFVSALIFVQNDNEYILADTYTDPQEAYEETQRALLLVSSKLNNGFVQLQMVEDNISKVNQVLSENFY